MKFPVHRHFSTIQCAAVAKEIQFQVDRQADITEIDTLISNKSTADYKWWIVSDFKYRKLCKIGQYFKYRNISQKQVKAEKD